MEFSKGTCREIKELFVFYTQGIGKWYTYGKDANAKDAYAMLTCVKHITMFVKITIFT